ncbi:lanthionine synthetase C family protein [uncultured Aquimarina sp.]|uniref:lanthionine synthetase C family protein n=1 Tax=uncultured Aquimarina sp. TaxID=575652 RepID=UPI002638E8A0|nr:lanthionine synthetase C family protein [uncultured Aquimarina sp.]
MNTTEILKEKLKEIHHILKENYADKEHLGVLSGISGISLFQFYYARFVEDEQIADIGVAVISETIQRMNDGYSFPTFCTGIAGAGWVLELLNEEEFIDIDNDELLSDLDNYLLESMESDIKNEYFDFLHGAIGYGYYFLKRYQNTASEPLRHQYKEYLFQLIKALRKSSHTNERGVFWKYELHKKDNLHGTNLSLSHGMASVINFLSRLYQYQDFQEYVKDLLIGAVDFIISYKYPGESQSSFFPSWVYPEMEKYTNSRLAWCYGDLGMGISLWKAGKALDNGEYKELAIQTLKNSTKRRDVEEARINDTGLCHGVFGIITMFNYMYKETKELIFKETADFWMEEALKMDTYKDGYAGYKQWRGDQEEWKNEANLLEGIAGIGLSMISYLAPSENQWNQCLMIN